MPIIDKNIQKDSKLSGDLQVQFVITETVQNIETRTTTIKQVENMIAYHQKKIAELTIELEELKKL